jgi:hypothetical protein
MTYENEILYCCNVKTYEKMEAIKDIAYELLDGDNKLKKIGSESNIQLDKNYKYNDVNNDNLLSITKKIKDIKYVIKINVKTFGSNNIINNIYEINDTKIKDIKNRIFAFVAFNVMHHYIKALNSNTDLFIKQDKERNITQIFYTNENGQQVK